MMQRAFLGVLTVIMFLAGYMSRAWTERDRPVPAPPAALTSEIRTPAKFDRAKLIADLEKLRPQIEAYTTQVGEIYAEFDRQFTAILTPAQQEKYAGHLKRLAERDAKRKADTTPLSDSDIMRARDRPLIDLYWMCTVTPRLEWLTKEYALDAGQQTAARALLTMRRNKFIALLDGTPHPSIRLSQLPPLIDRVMKPNDSTESKGTK